MSKIPILVDMQKNNQFNTPSEDILGQFRKCTMCQKTFYYNHTEVVKYFDYLTKCKECSCHITQFINYVFKDK